MLIRELLIEKYGDTYEGGEISLAEDPDYDMVEVLNTRGEEYGHYSVLLYHKGNKVEVVSADKEPTEPQKKQIILVAKKYMEDNKWV